VKYKVRHLTSYHYGEPVMVSHHAAHLRPRNAPGQTCRLASLKITPQPAVLNDQQTDYFGNVVTYFTIQEPHRVLQVESNFVVEMEATLPPPRGGGPAWDDVAAQLAAGGDPHMVEAMDFLFDSQRVPLLAEAKGYAAPSFTRGRPLAEAVIELTSRIHKDFEYDPSATSVSTPLEQVFVERKGVCQDFAHLQIACLRSMGLAARYVSGYIRTEAPPGKEKLVGADASHAWLAVFVPGWGWLELDPTNDTPAGTHHVVVAWGRDYDDVSPIKGVVLGGGEHQVGVQVDVNVLE
jgi:transglutaminase-like putative cysteine protease